MVSWTSARPGRAFLLAAFLTSCAATPPSHDTTRVARLATSAQLEAIQSYIGHGWQTLRRGHAELLASLVDPKEAPDGGRPLVVYVAKNEDLPAIEQLLKREMPPADFARITIAPLPPDADHAQPGILYLPRPYVVPGGRFNEMYGWDSYFIVLGLVDDGQIELARDMVDNHVYEVEHYGTILNANRNYYLTRSQPPLLTPMILAVYEHTHDKTWLAHTFDAVLAYHRFWVTPPHLTPETGLSRYYDVGRGPAPEVLAGEKDDQGKTHYDRAKEVLAAAAGSGEDLGYDVRRFYDAKSDVLTDSFYTADRSMRESGFDPSDRFGRLNLGVTNYDPVCLNTLLWVMERDLAAISAELGRSDAAREWSKQAADRRTAIDRYLWDEKQGVYFDYDFVHAKQRPYRFATTFFPLWAGLASREQAKHVAASLRDLEARGGVRTSTKRTGCQWDAPFGWAPLELVAAEGLRRYGFVAAADRISSNFLSLVLDEFIKGGTIFEKYDVEARSRETSSGVRFGYSSNEVGFGWTNAVYLELSHHMSPDRRGDLRRLDGVPIP